MGRGASAFAPSASANTMPNPAGCDTALTCRTMDDRGSPTMSSAACS
jgi:hypothetical protein